MSVACMRMTNIWRHFFKQEDVAMIHAIRVVEGLALQTEKIMHLENMSEEDDASSSPW